MTAGFLSVAAFAIGTLAPATGLASPADEARADVRFRDGEALFEARKYDEAAAALLESEQLDPELGTLINLALCHEALGKTATAIDEFETAATWAAQRRQPDREQYARQHAADLAKRASVVRVELPADRAGLTLAIDGEPLPPSRWAMPILLDPGSHILVASAPGMQDEAIAVPVADGPSDRSVPIAPLKPAPRETHAPASSLFDENRADDRAAAARRVLGLTAGGLGVVALSLASYFAGHDGRVGAGAIAAGAAGVVGIGGGAWLYFGAGPVGGRCDSGAGAGAGAGARVSLGMGVSGVW